MTRYTFSIDGFLNYEKSAVAQTEGDAWLAVWRSLPESDRDQVESFECINEEPATKIEAMIVKMKTDTTNAVHVLAENGYAHTTDTDNSDNDRFRKDGKFYKFAFPIWEMNQQGTKFIGVRIMEAV